VGTGQDCYEWQASGTVGQIETLARRGDGSQLAQRVRLVLGDHRLVGKSPEGSRQSHTGT
jgi:hypothetical protein